MKNQFLFLLPIILLFFAGCTTEKSADIIPAKQLPSISGQIKCFAESPIQGVTVEVKTNENIVQSVQTDANGVYEFYDLPVNSDYQVSFSYENNDAYQLEENDIELLVNQISGNATLNSFQYFVADMNNTHSLTGLDAVAIRNAIDNDTNTKWVFFSEDFDWHDQSGTINLFNVSNYQGDEIVKNFVGLKKGDVDGSICP